MDEFGIALKAMALLRSDLRRNISNAFQNNGTGELLEKSNVYSTLKNGQLTQLRITGPKHLFVQNYGFEGVKSNGINMRLKATDVVEKALATTNVIDFLATEISKARAEEIVIQLRG